ncbi:MAG: hypothetical protein JRF17_03625 [Deltaproteobacteria bacterium]|jgi:hypothetical protein|nr:hypothetical protein [Deltaproteobacteria bacterium]
MRKHRFYYHVTDVNNIDQVKQDGLKANEEGLIFVFTDMIVSGLIAREQYGLMDQYAAFKIYSDGITGNVIKDRVAEFFAPYQRVIIQEQISNRHIDFLGVYKIDPYDLTEWELLLRKRFKGLTLKTARKAFNERRKFIKKLIGRGD